MKYTIYVLRHINSGACFNPFMASDDNAACELMNRFIKSNAQLFGIRHEYDLMKLCSVNNLNITVHGSDQDETFANYGNMVINLGDNQFKEREVAEIEVL